MARNKRLTEFAKGIGRIPKGFNNDQRESHVIEKIMHPIELKCVFADDVDNMANGTFDWNSLDDEEE